MKIALVHDYIKEFGGAERVLRVLADMYPEAPIYTAFAVRNSDAYRAFSDRRIVESRLAPLIRPWRLYSPLRFLLPWIWESIDLSDYDLVITSCSNYIARGFTVSEKTKVVAYCHTPPRFLYGYATSFDWQKYWPVRVYGEIIGHFLRIYDFQTASKIDHWIANSKNVAARIEKFYRKESVVIYPPINVDEIKKSSLNAEKGDFYLIVSRLVGSKGLEDAVVAARKAKVKLKIAGASVGLPYLRNDLQKLGGKYIEFLGRVTDDELWRLYARAKGFIALARDEDFGMTVVEAQAAGTPVIAFNGGGFKESVIDGRTGILIDPPTREVSDGRGDTDYVINQLGRAFRKFEKIEWNRKLIQKNAEGFSRIRFEREIKVYLKNI